VGGNSTEPQTNQMTKSASAPSNLALDPVTIQFLCHAGLDPTTMSPTAIAEAKAFAEKENLHGVVREAEKRTQRTKKKKVARSGSNVSMKGAPSPIMRCRNSTAQQTNNELQARVLELEALVREMHGQELEMRERLSRVEQLLIQVLGEKQLPREETQSQYQSAEQLLEDHQLSADQFDSAAGYRTTVEQDSFMEEENEEDGMAQLADPYNIPEEEEFFLASQDSSRSTSNQNSLTDVAVFGSPLLEQRLEEFQTTTGKIIKIPPIVWKSIQKLESQQDYIETDGLYRVPGDKTKIQKIRADINQNNWETFDNCKDAAVIAGLLKMFLRELPEPLLPYDLHSELVKAAKKTGPYGDDVAKSMKVVLEKIDCPVVMDTLEVLAMHLGRVAEADNRMDVDNLGLLFGQGFLWPDPTAPVDMQFFAETANNCQVATTLIRFRDEIFCQDLEKP